MKRTESLLCPLPNSTVYFRVAQKVSCELNFVHIFAIGQFSIFFTGIHSVENL